jgi:hypothetical protein
MLSCADSLLAVSYLIEVQLAARPLSADIRSET